MAAVGLSLLFSLAGDLFTAVIFASFRIDVIQSMESFGSFSYMQGALLSNLSQIAAAYVYSLSKKGDAPHSSDKKHEERLLLILLVVQFFFLVWGLFFLSQRIAEKELPLVWYSFAFLQLLFALGTVWLLLKNVKNTEIRDMERRLMEFEKRNSSIHQYYAEIEQSYRSLHHVQHDFNNLLYTAYGVADAGDAEKAKSILKDMEQMLEEGEFHKHDGL